MKDRGLGQYVTDALGFGFLLGAGYHLYETTTWGLWSFAILVLLVAIGLFLWKDQLVTQFLETVAPFIPWLEDPDEQAE